MAALGTFGKSQLLKSLHSVTVDSRLRVLIWVVLLLTQLLTHHILVGAIPSCLSDGTLEPFSCRGIGIITCSIGISSQTRRLKCSRSVIDIQLRKTMLTSLGTVGFQWRIVQSIRPPDSSGPTRFVRGSCACLSVLCSASIFAYSSFVWLHVRQLDQWLADRPCNGNTLPLSHVHFSSC